MRIEMKNDLGQVYYEGFVNDKEGWIENKWIGYMKKDEVVAAAQKIMDNFHPLKLTKSLNDSTKGEGSDDAANEWLQTHLFPDAIANGLKKMAIVVSDDIFTKMTVEDLATRIPEIGFEMRTFESVDEAKEWLRAG